MYAEVMAYIDIDRESWKWSEIRKTSPLPSLEDVLKRMEKQPGNYGILAVPKSGSPRYEGLHSGINAADSIYAAGIVSPETIIVAVADDDEGWEDGVAKMVAHGAFVIFAEGLDPSIAEPVLPDGAIFIHKGRPPIVELKAGKFSEKGLCRLATSMEGSLTRAFANNTSRTYKEVLRETMKTGRGVGIVTAGHIHGWWNAYDYVDGFGAWTLGKTIISYTPEKGFTPINEEIKMMEDIGRIWGHVLDENEDVSLHLAGGLTEEALIEIREFYGIGAMIDARAAGVPLADILA